MTAVAGNDTLIGGAGNDDLTGGEGADTFVFDAAFGATNEDTIIGDFVSATDKIEVDVNIFTALAGSIGDTLDPLLFEATDDGLATSESTTRFVYNTTQVSCSTIRMASTGAEWDPGSNVDGRANASRNRY